jgi:hypothetical protein
MNERFRSVKLVGSAAGADRWRELDAARSVAPPKLEGSREATVVDMTR